MACRGLRHSPGNVTCGLLSDPGIRNAGKRGARRWRAGAVTATISNAPPERNQKHLSLALDARAQ